MTADPAALAATHAAAFVQSRAWRAAEFADLLGKPGVILCGDVRSFLLGRVIAGEAEVLTVATHPDFQRQGLAAGCLDRFLAEARVATAESAFLEVRSDNMPAKHLYSKAGFAEVARRKAYYTGVDGQRYDALILRKDLTGQTTL